MSIGSITPMDSVFAFLTQPSAPKLHQGIFFIHGTQLQIVGREPKLISFLINGLRWI